MLRPRPSFIMLAVISAACGSYSQPQEARPRKHQVLTGPWGTRRPPESRLGRRTALTFPLLPPPQKN